MEWNIQRPGRVWSDAEVRGRWALTPEKIELIDGRLLWSDQERLNLLGLLLENVGADAAVRLGDPAIWRAALDALPH